MRTLLAAAILAASLSIPSAHAEDVSQKVRQIVQLAVSVIESIAQEPESLREPVYFEIAAIEVEIGDIAAAEQSPIKDPNFKDKLTALIAVKKAEKGDVEGAEDTIFKIQNQLNAVDAHTGVGGALAEKSGWHAQDHFKQALDGVVLVQEPEDKVSRLTTLVRTEVKARYVRLTFAALEAISDAKTVCTLLEEVIQEADKEELQTVLDQIQLLKLDVCRDIILGSVAARQIAVGDAADVHKILDQIADPYQKAVAYHLIAVEKLAQNDDQARQSAKMDLYEAVRYLSQSDSSDKASLFCKIADAQMKTGETTAARQSLDAARVAALSIRDLHDKSSAFVDIGRFQLEYGFPREAKMNFEEAKLAARKIENDGDARASAFIKLAAALGLAGELDPSKEAFAHALALVQHVEKQERKTALLTDLALGQHELEWHEEALQTLGLARAAALEIADADLKSQALARIVIAHVELGDAGGAVLILEDIPDPKAKSGAFADAMALLAKKGQVEQAVSLSQGMSSKVLCLRGLLGAARGVLAASKEA